MSKKVVAVFSNTLFLNVIVCLLFLSPHNLFFDLGSQTVLLLLHGFEDQFLKNETNLLSQTVSSMAANIFRHSKWKEVFQPVFRTLTLRPGRAYMLLGRGLSLKIQSPL